jgi:glutamate/aspartate transport system substrate-binding protein
VPARAMEWRSSVSIFLFRAIFAALGPGFAAPVLADTLDKIRASGSIAIAYEEASVPFSSLGIDGKPVGYSIDLCCASLLR